MTRPLHLLVSMALSLAFAEISLAQAPPSADALQRWMKPMAELGSLRLRYGFSLRQGSQRDMGPALAYSGLVPNDIGLRLSYFGPGFLGMGLSLQREPISLGSRTQVLSEGSMLSGHAGVQARAILGRLRIEGLLGYGATQLPAFSPDRVRHFEPWTRHGPLLEARFQWSISRMLAAEASLDLPFLQKSRQTEGHIRAAGAGLALASRLGNFGKLGYGLIAEYHLSRDRVQLAGNDGVSQTVSRFGLGIELQWFDMAPAPPPPSYGALAVTVLDDESGAPVQDALVAVDHEAETLSVSTAADGHLRVAHLRPGKLHARATVAGYLTASSDSTIEAGEESSIQFRLKRVQNTVGRIVVTVADRKTSAPLAGATVIARGTEYRTNAQGFLALDHIPSGPLSVVVAVAGYEPMDEVLFVAPGNKTSMAALLTKIEPRTAGTVAGVTRDRNGAVVPAVVEVTELGATTAADANGRFSLELPPGTHALKVRARGYRSQSRMVKVAEGSRALLNFTLVPSP